jgi:hypothetical protein
LTIAGSSTINITSGGWTAPTGVYSVKVTVIGGGGGGSLINCSCNSPGLGGPGGYAQGVYTVTPGTGYNWSIGLGGAGTTGGTGASGGTTSFGGVISATGGAGGTQGNPPASGGAGSASGGTLRNVNGYYAPLILGSGNSNGAQAAAVWTINTSGAPGGAAYYGGNSGAILLEYVG